MTHELVITRAHFHCGALVAPTDLEFKTPDGVMVAWHGMVTPNDTPVAISIPGEGDLSIKHCPMSSVSICPKEYLMRANRQEFEKVQVTVKSKGRCVACGKTCGRTRVFWQTLNPFNTNNDGSVKTRDQIMVELGHRADKYRTEPLYHAKCEE